MREVRTKGTVLLEKCQAVEMPHTTSSLCLSPIPQKSLDKGRFSGSHSFPRGVHKNILFTNSPGLDSSLMNSTKHLKRIITILYILSQVIEKKKKGALPD